MNEEMLNAMEDIFEITKQVYNVPNTPLLREGMDTVAESLDIIDKEFINLINRFCGDLDRIKAMISELATSTADAETTRKAMAIVKEINIILNGEVNNNEMV